MRFFPSQEWPNDDDRTGITQGIITDPTGKKKKRVIYYIYANIIYIYKCCNLDVYIYIYISYVA